MRPEAQKWRGRTKSDYAAIFEAVRGVIHRLDPYALLEMGCAPDEFDSPFPRSSWGAPARGRVVQIEATSPEFVTRNGLSTKTPLSFLDRALNPKRYFTMLRLEIA